MCVCGGGIYSTILTWFYSASLFWANEFKSIPHFLFHQVQGFWPYVDWGLDPFGVEFCTLWSTWIYLHFFTCRLCLTCTICWRYFFSTVYFWINFCENDAVLITFNSVEQLTISTAETSNSCFIIQDVLVILSFVFLYEAKIAFVFSKSNCDGNLWGLRWICRLCLIG